MRALLIDRPGEARVVDVEEPAAKAGQATMRIRRIGLCGTDLSTYLGKNPLVLTRESPDTRLQQPSSPCSENDLGFKAGMDVTMSPYTKLREMHRLQSGSLQRVPLQPDARRAARRRSSRALQYAPLEVVCRESSDRGALPRRAAYSRMPRCRARSGKRCGYRGDIRLWRSWPGRCIGGGVPRRNRDRDRYRRPQARDRARSRREVSVAFRP